MNDGLPAKVHGQPSRNSLGLALVVIELRIFFIFFKRFFFKTNKNAKGKHTKKTVCDL